MTDHGRTGSAAPDETALTPTDPPVATRRRHRHTARFGALGILVVSAALVAALATRPSAQLQANPALIGQEAPAIPPLGADGRPMATHTAAGRTFSLASLRGRWVVVNFFASWCVACDDEESQLVAFARSHSGPYDPTIVGIVYDDSASNALHFLRDSGADWPAVVDPGPIKVDYGVAGPPETFVVSPEGKVVAHYDGPVTAGTLDGAIADAQAAGL